MTFPSQKCITLEYFLQEYVSQGRKKGRHRRVTSIPRVGADGKFVEERGDEVEAASPD
jgi:hypothetical protein